MEGISEEVCKLSFFYPRPLMRWRVSEVYEPVDLDWPGGIFAGMPDLVISKSSISSCVTYGGHIGLYSAWMDGWMWKF